MHPRQYQTMRQTFSPEGVESGGAATTTTEAASSDGSTTSATTAAASPSPADGTADAATTTTTADAAATTTTAEAVDPAIAAAEAARAVVPESLEGYAVNLPAELVKYTGPADDPAMKALREHAVEQKWSQGQFDDTLGVIKAFADKGVLLPMFDPAAEAAKLGENATARRQEVETLATSLKSRGEITDEEFGEMTSLAATAAGVTLMEKLRKMMTPGAGTTPTTPAGGDGSQDSEAMTAARAMRADPKYDTDNRFRRQADAAWVKAFEADKAARG